METTTSIYFLVSKGLSNDVGGGNGHRIFRGYGQELVSKPAISLNNCWGGYRSKTLMGGPFAENRRDGILLLKHEKFEYFARGFINLACEFINRVSR